MATFCFVNAFNKEDLPTFLFPKMAIEARSLSVTFEIQKANGWVLQLILFWNVGFTIIQMRLRFEESGDIRTTLPVMT